MWAYAPCNIKTLGLVVEIISENNQAAMKIFRLRKWKNIKGDRNIC